MSRLLFTRNDWPTLGVEIELMLVDAESMALKNCINDVLEHIPESHRERIKPELMQSYVEVNSEVCRTVSDARADLRDKLRVARLAAEKVGVRLAWSGTHPFSPWYQQQVTPTERYFNLVESLQETARRLVSFGLHVHVGVESGDKAVMICDRILRHLPTLLAISVNSPYWSGRDTGLQSARTKVLEGLPTAGLPPQMRNWSEYVWLVNHLIETKFIETIREIWWDVRPHHNFGTVEVRVCDTPTDLEAALGLTALVQCLVTGLSREIDRGAYQFDCHPMMVRQNKWRACRFGLEAELVDPYTFESRPARDVARSLADRLAPIAEELGCANELASLRGTLDGPTGADRQRASARAGDLSDVVKACVHDIGEASRDESQHRVSHH